MAICTLVQVVLVVALLDNVAPTNANVEGDVLYALRRAVMDPENVLESWDPKLVDPCTWFHVTCDGDNRVTRLDLEAVGQFSSRVGKARAPSISISNTMELYMNNLVGSIPLKSLVSLDLYHDNLTGSIPASLSKLSNLKFLRLNSKRLTGRIPRQLTKLGNLKILDLSNNDLCGTIPTSGSFSKFSEESFTNNPRLEGPELMGFVRYDIGECT
ncbi:hypothetical protein CRYUN_Cryun04dG0122600 [Craigia yunnanensis]